MASSAAEPPAASESFALARRAPQSPARSVGDESAREVEETRRRFRLVSEAEAGEA